MGSPNESEIRLAELIWRTAKLRVALLIFAIVVLLIVWSSLLNGNQEAQKIDSKFCEYLVDSHNSVQKRLVKEANKSSESRPDMPKLEPLLLSSEDQCHIGTARNWIEITKDTDEQLPFQTSINPSLDFMAKAEDEKRRAFADYYMQRHEAYRLQIQLSAEYSGSTIIVNALTVAKVIPFCVFLLLTIVLILGFQQTAYRRQLRALVLKKTGDELSLAMAETQFFAASLDPDPSHPEKCLAVSPIGLTITVVSAALLLLTTIIVWTFLLTLVQLTDSIILSYPFMLYASVILLSGILIITRESYLRGAESDTERDKRNYANPLSPGSKWLTLVSASVAGFSLVFPWATESNSDEGAFLRGFEFLLNQRPTGHLLGFTTYALSPSIFRDVRIQVNVAVAFLVICLADVLLPLCRIKTIMVFLHQVRRLLAVCVLILSVYYLAYMAFLLYESTYWVPWLDKLGYQGSPTAKGWSMMFYDPAYGFWMFLLCCLLLIWLSLKNTPDRLSTWVGQVTHTMLLKWRSAFRSLSE
jgi:hypothetical protein